MNIMRSQFVLDDETEALLNELSAARAGNRSFVVREAIHLYANLEEWLDTLEADPGLQRMVASSAEDIEAGRVMNSRQLQQRRNQAPKARNRR
jgi:predicted transcriptional regulator